MNIGEEISFDRIEAIKNISSSFSQLGEDYIFSHITDTSNKQMISRGPIKVAGMTFCLLLKGNLEIEVNNVSCHLSSVSLMLLHGTVVEVRSIEGDEIDAYTLFISESLLNNIQIDLNTIDFSTLSERPNLPIINNLREEEVQLLSRFMELLEMNASINGRSIYSRNAAISLIQGLFYQLMQIKYDHFTRNVKEEPKVNRRINYVYDFLNLLQSNCKKDRSLSYYADSLFISPKYLSRLVQERTGHSASEWIDRFVLAEAKNMLKFSNLNIQQVAYALNFPTQSSFGKFFKRLTGISPSEFQKS